MNRLTPLFLLGLLVLLRPGPVLGGGNEADAQVAEDEKLLRARKVAVDGPALLQFLRQQALDQVDEKRVRGLIRDLGDNNFRTREKAAADLIGVGARALPLLRESLKDADLELQRRAEKCIAAIERRNDGEMLGAVVRLVGVRRPDGACSVLLDYLPHARDATVEEAVLASLWGLAVRDGKVEASLLAALDDKGVARRAAAALLVARFGDPEQRTRMRKLLTDASPQVRFRGAQGLLAAPDRAAVPVLIALLAEGPYEMAQQAEESLRELAAKQAPDIRLQPEAVARGQCRDAWDGWWKEQKDQFKMTRVEAGLPSANPSWHARTIARRFLAAIIEGEYEALVKTIDFPFSMDGVATMKSQQEFDQFFKGVLQEEKTKKFTFEITGTGKADEYLAANPGRMGDFFKEMPAGEARIVYAQTREPSGAVHRGALVVRVRAGRARVVGLGQVREPAPPR